MNIFRRLVERLVPVGELFDKSGVRPMGQGALVVEVNDRSYWVRAERRAGTPAQYRVATSDVRDITDAPTIVAAPPAAESAVPEVIRRLDMYFARTRAQVTYF